MMGIDGVVSATDQALLTPRSRTPDDLVETGENSLMGTQNPRPGLTDAQLADSKWLLFLLCETIALLIFQIALGVYFHSLALIADSAHSSADVIGYGINYGTEQLKVRAAAKAGIHGSARNVDAMASRLDLIGCITSTVMLCGATWFATEEAVARLAPNAGDELGESGGGRDFGGIGIALLSFAVVSTAANAGTYALYHRWQRHASVRTVVSTSPGGADDTVELVPSVPDPFANGVPPPPVELPQMAAGGTAGKGGRSRRHRGGTSKLNLKQDFGGDPEGACFEACCIPVTPTPSSSANYGDGTATTAPGKSKTSWAVDLHRLVHPGCAGHHEHSGCCEEGTSSPGIGRSSADGGQEANQSSRVINLNVSSAMLHLASDVLRGITILVAAMLIEVGAAPDPGKADAICALLVAFFVVAGSLELLRRVGTAFCARKAQTTSNSAT